MTQCDTFDDVLANNLPAAGPEAQVFASYAVVHESETNECRPDPCQLTPGERGELYLEFTPLINRLVNQYGRNGELRQDMIGELYCRFDALLDAYDPKRGVPLRPYLVRQLSSAAYAFARQGWRLGQREVIWESREGGLDPLQAEDPTDTWDHALFQQHLAADLPAALRTLPERQRTVILHRYYEDRSFEEIGQIMGIQASTVRSMLRYALGNLRKQMGSLEA